MKNIKKHILSFVDEKLLKLVMASDYNTIKSSKNENILGGLSFFVNSRSLKGRVGITLFSSLEDNMTLCKVSFYKNLKNDDNLIKEVNCYEKEINDVLNYNLEKLGELRTYNKKPVLFIKKGDYIMLKNGIDGLIIKYNSNSEILLEVDGYKNLLISKEDISHIIT